MVLIPATAVALLLACAGALLRPRWDVAVLTGLLAAIWTRVNGPVEGEVLHEFTPGRGFTEADVLAVAAVAVALLSLLRCARAALRQGTSAPGGHRAAGAGSRSAAGAHQGP